MEAKMSVCIPETALAAADNLNDTWITDPYWLSWATKLDETDLAYFIPEVYETLVILTGKKVDYVPVFCGDMCLYVVGFYHEEQPFGPFWHESFKDKMKNVENRMARLCVFAQSLQKDLDAVDHDRLYLWLKSFRESKDYFVMHRLIVRRVGHLLHVDMDDHDLSKSRIVQIALGFLWHWAGKNDQSSHMKKLALDAIHAGHLEVENHHPEHEKTGMGCVDIHKLFVDRLSVHLQKDEWDVSKGWGINLNFIPVQYREEWVSFVDQHQMTNLYGIFDELKIE